MEPVGPPTVLEEDPCTQAALLAAIEQEAKAASRPPTQSAQLRAARAAELQENKRLELQALRAEAGANRGRWQWQSDKKWVDFEEVEQQMLHVAVLAGRHQLKLEIGHFQYEIFLDKLVQRNLRTGKERPIRLAPQGHRKEEQDQRLEIGAPRTGIAGGSGSLSHGTSRSCVGCTIILERDAKQCMMCGTVQPVIAGTEKETKAADEPTRTTSERTPGADASELRSLELCCQLGGQMWKDPDFPPTKRDRVTSWLRPSEIMYHDGRPLRKGEDWQLFRGEPRSDDVRQGALGDCWFLSALAALAEYQGGRFVRDLLPEQEKLNPYGVYLVRLCLGGRWKKIAVDDRLPCSGGGRYATQVAYCATYRLQIWASLVEKAYAKACGSYDAIVGGNADEALSVLTGWPCKVIRFDRDDFDRDLLWASLVSSRDAGFLMTCSTSDAEKATGLVPHHAYSFIDVIQIGDLKLLKIRNPHGKHTWRGPWSAESSEWTSALRGRLQYPEGGSAGIFFMCLSDFVRHFARCTICKVRSRDWCEARSSLRLPSEVPPCVGFEIEAFETSDCVMSLCQPQERLREGMYDNLFEPLACIGFVVLPQQTPHSSAVEVPKAVAAAQLKCRDLVSAECWLQAGHKYVIVPLSIHAGSTLSLSCACVSSRPVIMHQVKLPSSQVKSAWAAYAKTGPSKEKFEIQGGGALYVRRVNTGAVVAYAENRSTHGYLKVSLHYESADLRFSRLLPDSDDWLPPGHGQILQVALPSDPKGASWRSSQKGAMLHRPPDPPWHAPEFPADSLHAPFRMT